MDTREVHLLLYDGKLQSVARDLEAFSVLNHIRRYPLVLPPLPRAAIKVGAYLHACRNLRFDEKPDYAAMRSLLRERLPAVRRAAQTGLERSTREVDAPTC